MAATVSEPQQCEADGVTPGRGPSGASAADSGIQTCMPPAAPPRLFQAK